MTCVTVNEVLHNQGPYTPFLFPSDIQPGEVGSSINVGNTPTAVSTIQYITPTELSITLSEFSAQLDPGNA